ncbi:leucyl/phenylalanyl-tRNA--protein transferase [Rheinheimera salexigens]|uniref:Leucyl/phenylalanyl-tRNA--protein transferase n=1 Tax=Rheinheimera salexigens TaxID=1628148 RepID=A0A1E7QAC8_9GAMM|nr:leucyl/phenylalanyl-tRNA--protein transferase [Rheinheimera salexigens]
MYLPQLAVADVLFPPVEQALNSPDGLLAMGGDLSAKRLIHAYRQAIFPWFSQGDPILWWSPSQRAIFAPHTLSLNRSLRKQLQKQPLQFSINKCFEQVIRHCAAPRPTQAETWILSDIQHAYCHLHQLGHAHSLEVWHNNQLVGGLYGIVTGSLFCGESMFNLAPNMAKFALIALQQYLQQHASGWIDCQIPNPFLSQMGASTIARSDYLTLLQQQRDNKIDPACWQPRMITLATETP